MSERIGLCKLFTKLGCYSTLCSFLSGWVVCGGKLVFAIDMV
jgi:hypothetical protein